MYTDFIKMVLLLYVLDLLLCVLLRLLLNNKTVGTLHPLARCTRFLA